MNISGQNNSFSIGDVVYHRPTTLGPRRQNHLQLVYVHEGEFTVRVDRRAYDVAAGQATLLLPGHAELFRFANHGTTRHGWCQVDQPQLSPAAVEQLAARPETLPFTPAMQTLVHLAWPLARVRDRGSRQYRDALIQAIFQEFISRSGCVKAERRPLHPSVEKARRYLEMHFREKLAVVTIAKHVGMTPTHLIRLFKQQLGATPKRFLCRLRCEHAARLLKETGLTAAEIAYRSGFANPQHFSRVFRHTLGATPGAVRKAGWAMDQG